MVDICVIHGELNAYHVRPWAFALRSTRQIRHPWNFQHIIQKASLPRLTS